MYYYINTLSNITYSILTFECILLHSRNQIKSHDSYSDDLLLTVGIDDDDLYVKYSPKLQGNRTSYNKQKKSGNVSTSSSSSKGGVNRYYSKQLSSSTTTTSNRVIQDAPF